ncbi:MAG: DUF3110 domain-containing protein [Oscillatoria sp. Prado101]|jgi:hypothetical protein|nr:DUF3110 domain-containing protein [Oscillatoria sp. Prado101]
MRVFVLLFNARTENEGIHTLKDLRSQRNKVLMFESEDDATRYAMMLEAQDFPTATVEAVEDEEVKEFCSDCDYDWEIVPESGLAVPPESNVDQTDWQAEKSEEAGMSDSELDRIRRQLEGLI